MRNVLIVAALLAAVVNVEAQSMKRQRFEKQAVKINGTRVRWENKSRAQQVVRIAWSCRVEKATASDDVLRHTRELKVAPGAVATVESGYEGGKQLCGNTCDIEVGYLTPWPIPAGVDFPEFKGLVASASTLVVCR